jgi:nucleotide-binding universal stress UspA family protein
MKRYKIKKILVPIDFSRISLYALQHAERIGKLTRARITLLHVVEVIVDSIGIDAGALAAAMNIERELQVKNRRALSRLAKATARRTGLKVDAKVSIGKPSTVITRTGSSLKADLILMGTHGASGFVEKLLGSTTYRVAAISKIPVLSVHKQPRRAGFADLVYPVRQGTTVMKKFPYALTFAKLFGAQVHVVGQAALNNDQRVESVKGLCAGIESEFDQHGLTATSNLSAHEDFAEAVVRYSGTCPGAFVVIMQDRDFGLIEVFRGSFTKKLLHRLLSPILTIPN